MRDSICGREVYSLHWQSSVIMWCWESGRSFYCFRRKEIVTVKWWCFFGERNCRLRALIDTGNTLKDTVSKDPVSVMDQASVKRLTEGKQPERFRYIPYHSIGKKRGSYACISHG